MTQATKTERDKWIAWLDSYGAGAFYDAFVKNAQGARGRCVNCRRYIYLDIVEGGGVTDWRTDDGDYGCDGSPDTDTDGVGGHTPERQGDDR